MPSGFNQDINQLAPSFYRIGITMDSGTAIWPTENGTNNGAVNPKDWNSFVINPTSTENAERVARGNLRFQAIIEEVSKFADVQILDVEITSADLTDSNEQPTALHFTVKYDRDMFILDSYQKLMLAEDATNTTFVGYGGGVNVVDTTAKAIRELVTRAIIRGGEVGWSKMYRVFSPGTTQDTAHDTQTRVTITQPDAPADIWADVAVNLIDGTELIN